MGSARRAVKIVSRLSSRPIRETFFRAQLKLLHLHLTHHLSSETYLHQYIIINMQLKSCSQCRQPAVKYSTYNYYSPVVH